MTEDRFVLSAPSPEDMMMLQRRLEAAEALARERLGAIETLEWERDRLRVEVEQKRAEASLPRREPRRAGSPGAQFQATSQATSQPQPPVAPARPNLARRVAFGIYRVIRPVVRPVAWRVRQFLVGELRQELAEVSRRQALLVEKSKSGTGILDAAFVASMERLLVTLALEQKRDCTRTGPAAGLSNGDSDG